MRKLFAAVLTLALAIMAPNVAQALPLPTPAPTPATLIPTHIPTYAKIGNCYHLDASTSFNGGCSGGQIQAASGAGATTDIKNLSKYVNFAEVSFNSMEGIRVGGIKGVFYTDPFIIHGPNVGNGLSRSIGGSSSTTFCPSALPQFVTLQDATNYGNTFNAPNYNRVLCSGNYYGSTFGDVTQNAQTFWENVIEQSVGFSPTAGLGGFNNGSYAYKTGVDDVRQDDADYPADRFDNTFICEGSAVSQGTTSLGATPTSCASYGAQSAATRAMNPYFAIRPYPYFMAPGWITGIQGMFRMPGLLGARTVFNDMTNPLFYQYFNNGDKSNVEIAQCEGCFTQTSGNLWSEGTWQDHVNAEIVAENWGVKFDSFNPGGETTVADTILAYASLMMGMVDPTLTVTTDQVGGGTATNSLIAIPPLVYLVPTQPVNQPATFIFDPIAVNYQPVSSTPATTYGVGTLKQPGGAYLREFSACYNGQPTTPTVPKTPVNIGGCAVVVVPAGAVSPTMPTTVGTYKHTATYTGSGIVQESGFGGGDTGLLSIVGAAPPATGAALVANAAYVLTP